MAYPAWQVLSFPTTCRGALLGLFVSFAFYSATGFTEVVGFVAGIIYGVIIEYAALKLGVKAE